MVIVTQQDYLVKREYYKDQMREAEKHRLVRQALAGRGKRDRFYSGVLTWIGHRLIAWGSSLQERHNTMVPASIPQSANHMAG